MAAVSDSEDSAVDNLIKERLKSCQVTSKGMISGCLESRQDYDDLVRDMKVLGCCYSVRSCSVGKPGKGTLQYKTIANDIQIPYSGSPFHVEGTTYFQCTQGARYYKSRSDVQDEEDESELEQPKRKRRKVTRDVKVGCPAKMTVKCVRLYPDYKSSGDTWRRKFDVLKKLKADLKTSTPPRSVIHYWVAISPESIHTHKRTTTQTLQTLHPDLIVEIHKLVFSGISSVPIIKNKLRSVVLNMFKDASVKPDLTNTAFYPNDKTIYNHAHCAKLLVSSQNENQSNGDGSEHLTLPENDPSNSERIIPSVSTMSQLAEERLQKSVSDVAVVPLLEGAFSSDWQDQAGPGSGGAPNLVQVVHSNGTIMLMLAQPVGDQSLNRISGAIDETSGDLETVQIGDNIYTVSVGDQSGRIISLNDDGTILMSQSSADSDEINHSATVSSNERLQAVTPEKSCIDMNRVITMEGNVVDDVTECNSSLPDKEQTLQVVHDSSNAYLYHSPLKQQQAHELFSCEPQLDVSENDIENNMGKDHCEADESDLDLGCDDQENSEDDQDVKVVMPLTHIEKSKCSANDITIVDSELSTSVALRDCAQDIINMSFWCTNNSLMEEMLCVFNKYRENMHADIGKKQNPSEHVNISSYENVHIQPTRYPVSNVQFKKSASPIKSFSRKDCKPVVYEFKRRQLGRSLNGSLLGKTFEDNVEEYEIVMTDP